MTRRTLIAVLTGATLVVGLASPAVAKHHKSSDKPVEKWVTVTGEAAGVDLKAKDEAIAQALRKAVEQACGVFLTSQSKTEDYQATYDKVFANTVGYIKRHKEPKVWTEDDMTFATVRVLVSTRKFEEDWAAIAHTVDQEDNPRVIVAILESIRQTDTGPSYEVKEHGTVQSRVEDFFIEKGITLKDRATATDVSKRDVLLAALKDDDKQVAALGARFKSDVVLTGRASAKYGKSLEVAGQTMYQYTATLSVRVVQTDSATVLVSKSYGPVVLNTLQRGGGEDKALAKLADEAAPKILKAVVEAWRKRGNVMRSVQINISGMDYDGWKTFRDEVKKLRGVQGLRLRDITQSIANIDVEYRYSTQNLADNLESLKDTKLEVTEFTANRLKFKLRDGEEDD